MLEVSVRCYVIANTCQIAATYDDWHWHAGTSVQIVHGIQENLACFLHFALQCRLRLLVDLKCRLGFIVIRPPGTMSSGRAYVLPQMCLFLFRHSFSELPRPIALKLCHMVGIWLNFIILLQKFGGHSPKTIWAKNMQDFGQFWTISDFDREYLRNDATCPKSLRRTN